MLKFRKPPIDFELAIKYIVQLVCYDKAIEFKSPTIAAELKKYYEKEIKSCNKVD